MPPYAAIGLVAVLAVGLALPAAAATPRLEVTVTNEQIRLSDLFTDLSPDRDAVVTAAPAAGGSLVFDARFLTRIARIHRVDWEPVTGTEQTIVRRGSIEIGPEDLRPAIAAALTPFIPVGRIEIQFDDPRQTVHVPLDQGSAIEVTYIEGPQSTNRFRASVTVGTGNGAQRILVAGRAVGIIEVPALARWVRPGDEIAASDLIWIETQYNASAGDLITRDTELVGMSPRRPVAVNRALRQRDFQPPRLVEKGAIVTMVVRSPWMLLTARGRALDHGGRGDVIRVANVQSNRIVEGTITGQGEVSVGPLGTAAAPIN